MLFDANGYVAGSAGLRRKHRTLCRRIPGPGIAEPDRRQELQLGCFGTAIVRGDANEHVFRRSLRIFHDHVEVAVIVENARIAQFEFRIVLAAAIVFDKLAIRKRTLRIFVEILHIGMCWRRIQIKVIFLYVLAVISFAAGKSEKPLFQNRVVAIPKRERETGGLMAVRDAAESVFAPAIRTRARLVMRKIIPSRAVLAIVFAHRAPLAFAEIRPPALPVALAVARFLEPLLFSAQNGLSSVSH